MDGHSNSAERWENGATASAAQICAYSAFWTARYLGSELAILPRRTGLLGRDTPQKTGGAGARGYSAKTLPLFRLKSYRVQRDALEQILQDQPVQADHPRPSLPKLRKITFRE